MEKLLGYKELLSCTGDISQVFYAKRYLMQEGKAEGIRAVDINNGAGLEFSVLADRGLDIGRLAFRGLNFSYISKSGYVSPEYFDAERGGVFIGGLLSTCGLRNAGPSSLYQCERLKLHGGVGSIPAEDFCVKTDILAKKPVITVEGKLREGAIFGPNLWLTRTIKVYYGENKIYLKDIIENRGYKKEPFMLLYHCNFGYPLLNEKARLYTSCDFVKARDREAEKGIEERCRFSKPIPGFKEQCYFYKQREAEKGKSFSALINEELGVGAAIWVRPGQLGKMTVWKNPGAGDYVMGIEPGNCFPIGAEAQEAEGGLEFLEPLSLREVDWEIEILYGERLQKIKELSDRA